MSVLFLWVVRMCDVQGSGRLLLCCAAVKVGKAEIIPVRFEFAAGVRVVQCRLRLSWMAKRGIANCHKDFYIDIKCNVFV